MKNNNLHPIKKTSIIFIYKMQTFNINFRFFFPKFINIKRSFQIIEFTGKYVSSYMSHNVGLPLHCAIAWWNEKEGHGKTDS